RPLRRPRRAPRAFVRARRSSAVRAPTRRAATARAASTPDRRGACADRSWRASHPAHGLLEVFARSTEARRHRTGRNADERRDRARGEPLELEENEHRTRVLLHRLEDPLENAAPLLVGERLLRIG